jgi:hypothetical protein
VVSSIGQWTLDVTGMARFWAAALGHRVEAGNDGHTTPFPEGDEFCVPRRRPRDA